MYVSRMYVSRHEPARATPPGKPHPDATPSYEAASIGEAMEIAKADFIREFGPVAEVIEMTRGWDSMIVELNDGREYSRFYSVRF